MGYCDRSCDELKCRLRETTVRKLNVTRPMIELLFFSLPVIFFSVPWFWRSWKSLITWHVIVSVFLNYFYLETGLAGARGGGGGGSDAVGSAGTAIYAFFMLFLHLFSSGANGFIMYIRGDNGRGLKVFPVYAIIAVLAYILIFIVIYFVVRIGFVFIHDLDFSNLRKK